MKPYRILFGGTSLKHPERIWGHWVDLDHINGISDIHKDMEDRNGVFYGLDHVGYPPARLLCHVSFEINMAFQNEPLQFNRRMNGLLWSEDENRLPVVDEAYMSDRALQNGSREQLYAERQMSLRVQQMKQFCLGYSELLSAWLHKDDPKL